MQKETRSEAMKRFEQEKAQAKQRSDEAMLELEHCLNQKTVPDAKPFEVEHLFTADTLRMRDVEQWLMDATRASKKRRTKKKLIKL